MWLDWKDVFFAGTEWSTTRTSLRSNGSIICSMPFAKGGVEGAAREAWTCVVCCPPSPLVFVLRSGSFMRLFSASGALQLHVVCMLTVCVCSTGIHVLKCVQRRAAVRQLKEERVRSFEYVLPCTPLQTHRRVHCVGVLLCLLSRCYIATFLFCLFVWCRHFLPKCTMTRRQQRQHFRLWEEPGIRSSTTGS